MIRRMLHPNNKRLGLPDKKRGLFIYSIFRLLLFDLTFHIIPSTLLSGHGTAEAIGEWPIIPASRLRPRPMGGRGWVGRRGRRSGHVRRPSRHSVPATEWIASVPQ